jgi:hypothetical protein
MSIMRITFIAGGSMVVGAAALALLHARPLQPSDVSARPLSVERLGSPAGKDSSAPQITVAGGRAFLSWMEREGLRAALTFAERTTAGWSEPRVVVAGENLVINSADVPSVRALADGTLVAHWLEENGPDPEAYNLRLAWSRDEGRTWSAAASPHHDGTETQHGFASLFHVPGAGVGVVWLDGRDTRGTEGDMALRGAVFDPGGRQVSEVTIDARVCECCPTSVAVTSEGPIVAYRDRSSGEIRDIYVSRLVAGRWTAPVPVHADRWEIEGCPVNGPAVSARGRDVVVAWFTATDEGGGAFVAFSRDAGRTFGDAIRVDEMSSLGRVGVELLEDRSAVVGWIEYDDRGEFKVRRVTPAGHRSAASLVAEMSGTRYPRVALAGGEVLLAWTATEDGSARVRTARASVR